MKSGRGRLRLLNQTLSGHGRGTRADRASWVKLGYLILIKERGPETHPLVLHGINTHYATQRQNT